MAPNNDHHAMPDPQQAPTEGVQLARGQDTANGMYEALTQSAVQAHTTEQPKTSSSYVLPPNVISRSDISKSLRELTVIDDYFHQAAIRGSKDQTLPTLGKALGSLAEANQLNLLHAEDRAQLKSFLTKLKAQAPVVHMSFPSEASASFLAKILEWFRANVHPYTVLHIGLQPELAAGCVVRTTNKQFDFSFRKRLEQSKQKLIAALEAANKVVSEEMRAEEAANQQPAAQSVSTTGGQV